MNGVLNTVSQSQNESGIQKVICQNRGNTTRTSTGLTTQMDFIFSQTNQIKLP